METYDFAATGTPHSRPLLTLCIPTWNRAHELRLLLEVLAPQVADAQDVELLISDNQSTDETPAVLEQAIAKGLRCRYVRNAENIGADANFLQCYRLAQGKHVWIFGDDDVLLPGSLLFVLKLLRRREYELVYLQPFGFVRDVNERGQANASPEVREFKDPVEFLEAVGHRGDLVMLSAVIFDKDRIEADAYPAFEQGKGTNLLQMGWVFTALKRMRAGLVVDRGLYAVSEANPRRGFDVVRTFGPYWSRSAHLYLAPDERLIRAAENMQLETWFPTCYYGMRKQPEMNQLVNPVGQMKPVYGNRWQFWFWAWPLLAWPMLPAGAWLFMLRKLRTLSRRRMDRRHPPLKL